MSAAKYTYEQIEEYLLGIMTNAEKERFEQELASNDALRSELDIHRLASEFVIEHRIVAVKSQLSAIDTQSRARASKRIIGGISGLLLLLGGTYLLLNQTKTITTPQQPQMTQPVLEKVAKPLDAPQTSPAYSDKKEGKIGIVSSPHPISASSPNKQEAEKTALPLATETQKTAPLPEPMPVKEDLPQAVKALKSEAAAPTVLPVDPCKLVQLTAQISTHPSCADKKEGMILISQPKGGTAPYKTSILDEEQNAVASTHTLSSGYYTVMMADARGCVQKFQRIFVPSKNCPLSYSFNPFLGETWEIPVPKQNATLRIMDNTGNLYFSKDLKANEKENWSGQSLHGEQKSGYFPFEIRYEDGSSVQGSITIVK